MKAIHDLNEKWFVYPLTHVMSLCELLKLRCDADDGVNLPENNSLGPFQVKQRAIAIDVFIRRWIRSATACVRWLFTTGLHRVFMVNETGRITKLFRNWSGSTRCVGTAEEADTHVDQHQGKVTGKNQSRHRVERFLRKWIDFKGGPRAESKWWSEAFSLQYRCWRNDIVPRARADRWHTRNPSPLCSPQCRAMGAETIVGPLRYMS